MFLLICFCIYFNVAYQEPSSFLRNTTKIILVDSGIKLLVNAFRTTPTKNQRVVIPTLTDRYKYAFSELFENKM